MKKILLSVVVIVAFIVYAVTTNGKKTQTQSTAPEQSNTSTSSQSTTQKSTGAYKDGEYTGDTTDAVYGNIQVKAVISGGKLADVQFLQYPNDRDESRQISSASIPQLKNEAIQAQTAKVDTVSGATQTSEAFVKSLESALNQAKS